MIKCIKIEKEYRKRLKYLALEKDCHVSDLLTNELDRLVNEDEPFRRVITKDSVSYSLNIHPKLAEKLMGYVYKNGCNQKDVWNQVVENIIKNEV